MGMLPQPSRTTGIDLMNMGMNSTPAAGLDPVERYFECITACSIHDGECVTQCVEVLRSAE